MGLQVFSLFGFAVFFVASLGVGVRLLLLWRRTRQLPELLIGVGVLGIGPVGFGLSTIAEALRPAHPAVAQAIFAPALLALAIGAISKYLFNWRVYHPSNRAVKRFVWAMAGLAAGVYLADGVVTRFRSPWDLNPGYFARSAFQIGCLLWGSAESLRYWVMMRRRLRLGLADPIVTNRFFLWGLGAGAAGIGTAVGIGMQAVTGVSALEHPGIMLSSSLHGLVAAIAMWLAFVPNARYRRFIEGRALAPSV